MARAVSYLPVLMGALLFVLRGCGGVVYLLESVDAVGECSYGRGSASFTLLVLRCLWQLSFFSSMPVVVSSPSGDVSLAS